MFPPLLTWPRVVLVPIFISIAAYFGAQIFISSALVAVAPVTVAYAEAALESLAVVEPDPQGYDRSFFGPAWAGGRACDTRNEVLKQWLNQVEVSPEDPCVVDSGWFIDPYTSARVDFVRGKDTSAEVHVDHVVALADAWAKGAAHWSQHEAQVFANDPLNLLPTPGWVNEEKGALAASEWLPPNPGFICFFGVQQTVVKHKYSLGVSNAELASLKSALTHCD